MTHATKGFESWHDEGLVHEGTGTHGNEVKIMQQEGQKLPHCKDERETCRGQAGWDETWGKGT